MSKLDFIDKDLTIKEPPDFTVISTFAGCGGSSTGYVWAGGKVLLAVEWNNNAAETYKLNYPTTPVYCSNIANLSVEECISLAGVQPGRLDILDGLPPCQGFSTAGKRKIGDRRNQLFREFVRLLRGLRPKVFVMENVSGLVKGKMKLIFAEIMQELKGSGYRVSCRLMNTMYFGVPQSRRRLIFIGVRDDLGIEPSYPKAQTRPIVARDAIGFLAEERKELQLTAKGYEVWKRNGNFNSVRLLPNRVANTVTGTQRPHGVTGLSHWHWPQSLAVEELACLSSFPNCFEWVGKYSTKSSCIGNSVPPRFMQAIAEHIYNVILLPSKQAETKR